MSVSANVITAREMLKVQERVLSARCVLYIQTAPPPPICHTASDTVHNTLMKLSKVVPLLTGNSKITVIGSGGELY